MGAYDGGIFDLAIGEEVYDFLNISNIEDNKTKIISKELFIGDLISYNLMKKEKDDNTSEVSETQIL